MLENEHTYTTSLDLHLKLCKFSPVHVLCLAACMPTPCMVLLTVAGGSDLNSPYWQLTAFVNNIIIHADLQVVTGYHLSLVEINNGNSE